MNARLFLALWPDPATRAELVAWQRSVSWPAGARLVPPENLHATLHFIGNVPVERLPEVREGLAVPGGRGALTFTGVEVWKDGIAVLVPSTVPAGLLELHARLADRLVTLGLPVEYPTWRPHVTLARKAPGVVASVPPAVAWRSEGYALVQSTGVVYTALEHYR